MVNNSDIVIISGITELVAIAHGNSVAGGWYTDAQTGQPKERNEGEMFALMHSEISEALEGIRKNKMDDHLPHRRNVEVEMADLVIRVADYCGYKGLDLAGAIIEKMAYNKVREDHKLEQRKLSGGKAF